MKIALTFLIFLFPLLAKEHCIKNFNKQICGNFELLNSVIVKTPLSKKQIQKKFDKKVQQIAFLDENNLYIIPSENPIKFAKQLSEKSYIIYAQPNISQKRTLNSYGKKHDTQVFKTIDNLWKTTKGEGVNIAIIDDGFNLKHKDLINTKLLFSYDTDNKNLNSSPKLKLDNHGTQVAGIIFAKHNDIGIDGIAPDANLIAIRQTNNITSDTIISFTVASKTNAHIINCSWNSPILLEPIYDVIKHISKNTAIVFAAGNNAKKIKPLSIEASIDEVITVGANTKYSNYGKMVDFVTSGAITTTKDNDSYGIFNGTSASAPIISGLLALKMSQYPNIHYRKLVDMLKIELYK